MTGLLRDQSLRGRSVFGLKANDDARGLGFVRRQFRKVFVAPIGKVYNSADLDTRFGRFGGFQDVKPASIAELPDDRREGLEHRIGSKPVLPVPSSVSWLSLLLDVCTA
jgi:hypothetical protein